MTTALILAAHGSHLSPHTAGIVWHYVDLLRQQGVADEITACFWKEAPHFHQALSTVSAEQVVIVPIFTAAGYFSQDVIPMEMGLSGALTQVNGRTIYYTPPLGEHPDLGEIVKSRFLKAVESTNAPKEEITVVIIGHGTRRSATTRQTTQAQVRELAALGLVSAVLEAYLDDEPDIPSIYERTEAKHIVALPFFLAFGSHVTIDVPEALGIHYGDYPANVDGRKVYYAPPLGTDESICELILSLARQTGIDFSPKTPQADWSGFPQAGADTLMACLEQSGQLEFGEIILTAEAVYPHEGNRVHCLDNPTQLREHIRENPFRPLATSRDLPRDWFVPIEHLKQIPAVLETIYPSLLADWSAQAAGDFYAETLEAVSQRQQGMFQHIAQVDSAVLAHFVGSVCGRCIRRPSWYEGQNANLPCSAPCNLFLSQLKEGTL